MVLDLNCPNINIYNHLLCNNKEKRTQETNPQHKQDLPTKIHKAFSSHSSSTSSYGNTIQRYLNSYLTILTFNLFLCIIDFTILRNCKIEISVQNLILRLIQFT
jgi:hypothetical protein